eukprot:TRINITY_DN888_c0_g1_i1.p1 TRINITY_DN888_c0_g1~~TRINITY_DN888_c0_g1_i1.p1  ORF type:complete len:155 (-),score=37.48 TRINITY_DN888_c0_g1_i1:76-540(-)
MVDTIEDDCLLILQLHQNKKQRVEIIRDETHVKLDIHQEIDLQTGDILVLGPLSLQYLVNISDKLVRKRKRIHLNYLSAPNEPVEIPLKIRKVEPIPRNLLLTPRKEEAITKNVENCTLYDKELDKLYSDSTNNGINNDNCTKENENGGELLLN